MLTHEHILPSTPHLHFISFMLFLSLFFVPSGVKSTYPPVSFIFHSVSHHMVPMGGGPLPFTYYNTRRGKLLIASVKLSWGVKDLKAQVWAKSTCH